MKIEEGFLEYEEEHYQHLLKREHEFQLSYYHDTNQDITVRARCFMLEWMNDILRVFHLTPEIFHLAVYIMDKSFGLIEMTKTNYQLVLVVSMFIAGKYNNDDELPIASKEYVKISKNQYSKEEMLEMEIYILNAIDYRLEVPTSYMFTTSHLKELSIDEEERVAIEIVEKCVLWNLNYVKYKSSLISLCAIYLVKKALKLEELKLFKNYSSQESNECLLFVNSACMWIKGLYSKEECLVSSLYKLYKNSFINVLDSIEKLKLEIINF